MKQDFEYFADGRVLHGWMSEIMGTRFDLLVFGQEAGSGSSMWRSLTECAATLDMMLNRFDPASEVSRINAASKSLADELSDGEQMQCVSDEITRLLSRCENYWRLTGGLFDITKGDFGRISFSSDDTLVLRGATLDFGGIAKGWFVNICVQTLRQAGVETAYVDFGGSTIFGLGHHPYGDCWKVGITDPFTGTLLETVSLRDRALSISGDQPGYTGHIINPRTGERCQGRGLVSVMSPDPLDAEALSTALIPASEGEAELIMSRFPSASYKYYRTENFQ